MSRASDDQLDLIFHALSDRTRRKMLRTLAKHPAMITELAEPFSISLPAVSKHLRVLESAGLVERRVDGRIHQCSLAAGPLQKIERWLHVYRNFWEGSLDSLARYAERR
jgi:DNA-binding transcriptional ArsR family regulator